MYGRDVRLEAAEIAFDKALLHYETLDRLHELQIHEAELQCYAESADTDTYLSYMESVNEQASEKKQSVMLKLLERVKELFRTLIAKFFGKNKGKDLPKDDKFAVPKPLAAFIKKAKSLVAGAKSAIMNTKKKLSENPKWKALVIALTAAVGTISIIRIKNHLNNKKVVEHAKRTHYEDIAIQTSDFIRDEALSRAKAKGIETHDGCFDIYMNNKDVATMTGLELNDGYMSMNELFNTCRLYSDEMISYYKKNLSGFNKIDRHNKMTHDDVVAANVKEMELITKYLKPILDKIVFVRLSDDDISLGNSGQRF